MFVFMLTTMGIAEGRLEFHTECDVAATLANRLIATGQALPVTVRPGDTRVRMGQTLCTAAICMAVGRKYRVPAAEAARLIAAGIATAVDATPGG